LWSHAVHRAQRRNLSLDTPARDLIMSGTKATGE